MGKLCCAGEHFVQFFLQFYNTVKLHSMGLFRFVEYDVIAPQRSCVSSERLENFIRGCSTCVE
jgi:hypothetical protein